jgi:AbrB family looped-hinge helix DNA binding protein
MRVQAKVTSKGQVTVPIEIRQALGIVTGDMLVFEVAGEYATVAKKRSALEIADELRDRHPELSRGPVYAAKADAVEAHVVERVATQAESGRHRSEVRAVGRPGGCVTSGEAQ